MKAQENAKKCKETRWNVVKHDEMRNMLKVRVGKRNVMAARSVGK